MPSDLKDPYQVLGVSSGASQDEIKTSYRNLAKKFHPDLNPGNKKSEKTFKEINAAYELVGTAEARKKFEQDKVQAQAQAEHQNQRRGPYYYQTQQGAHEGRYSSEFADGFDGDLFESLFRGRGGHSRSEPEAETYEMEIDLADAIHGGQREITLPSGKRLSVKIPEGVNTGMKLRFPNQGATGDVFIRINVKPSQQFKIEGEDLVSELSVDIVDAILGSEVKVPTIDGEVLLKIPPHIDSDKRVRIPGKGLFDRKTKKRGSQIYVVKLRMPATISPEMEKAARNLRS